MNGLLKPKILNMDRQFFYFEHVLLKMICIKNRWKK